ncbi:guanylate kinase [Ostreibacterium oceani]|uniref:Guanylate kinase n=1 Tax=Ostreibacterium oceani TaxID=2654998 RepID=A0A6N7EUL5_9GAMM|nr:guanylate kinase [Ostreibacterium oceani]MPV86474.1 guanylate kinase [Ostreibacterium oceani]
MPNHSRPPKQLNALSTGQLWVVAAPSGGGKTSLVEAAINKLPHLVRSISFTTRPQRPGELDGVDYRFVDLMTFQHLIDSGDMLEYEQVFDNYYGTSSSFINTHLDNGNDVILTIDWQGARQIRQKRPHSKSIFILPPDIAALEKRLSNRGQDNHQIITKRMAQAPEQITHHVEFDYLVINDYFDNALQDIITIIRANRLSQPRQAQQHTELIDKLLSI